MAIGRLSVKTGNKGKAKAHAKYILREDKYAKRIEEKGDILEKKGHGNMPEWAKDNPNFFWEMADEMERKNGSAYREHIITLPRELNAQQRLELVQDWIKNEIGDKHPYSFAIHNPPAMDGKEQPHCHLMFCERELDGIKRSPDQFFKRYNAKSPEKGGAKKLNTGLDYTTRKQQLKDLRQRWEKTCNKHLLKVSKFVQISMKSLKDRGIDRQPTNISMAEMNKPSIKEAYKEKLNASKEFIQAYVQVGKGMNVKAELAKEPAKETPAPKPAEPKQPQATPPKAPAVAPKSTPSTADKLERPAPKPATPPPPPPPSREQIQAQRNDQLKQAWQTIKDFEKLVSDKAEVLKNATVKSRAEKAEQAKTALDNHLANKPLLLGKDKWEATKKELENAKVKANLALAQATGDTEKLKGKNIEPIDYTAHAIERLDKDPATKAQHDKSDQAKAQAERILSEMANEKAQEHGADFHAKQGVTYSGKIVRADDKGVLQQTQQGIVYYPYKLDVKEGKGYNITLTGNDRYKVQEQMEIRQPSKDPSQNLDKGKGR